MPKDLGIAGVIGVIVIVIVQLLFNNPIVSVILGLITFGLITFLLKK